MYPILILRCELACLVILIFLYFTSRSYNIDSESKTFKRILDFAILHVFFDIITVLTVNNTDVIPAWGNWVCHVAFYITAILFSQEIVNYVVAIVYPAKAKKLYAAGHLLIALYILSLSFLKIEYVEDLGTYSSAGPAAVVGYALAFSFFIAALVLIFTHLKIMSDSFKAALIPMMLVLMCTEVCQVIWRSVLFTGGAITIVTVGFFFSLENPVTVFRKKAMTDALTGVRSRSSFEEDIDKLDQNFRKKPNEDYTFVFCDLDDLRSVNNHFGHEEGDNYITLIASSISRCLQHASAVYRIGGDEFLVLYETTGEATVEQELRALQDACAAASEDLDYRVSVSVGYARSSADYKQLRDVVKTADFAMYQNKSHPRSETAELGTKLNYAGLTDHMFEAMCASDVRNYPFLTNLDTGVTRIAPGWKEYFGLDEEFFADFVGMWKDRIRPEDYEGYMADILAVLTGRKKYHSYEYFARRADGEYVPVSCRGSVYQDAATGISFFSGFIVNHGLDENIDPATGLRSFTALTACVSRRMDEGRHFSLMKLQLNNFARVDMLYGYMDKNGEVLQKLLTVYRKATGDNSEPMVIGGGTYARSMPNIIAFGPMLPGRELTEHQKNEYILKEDLFLLREIYKEAILALANV